MRSGPYAGTHGAEDGYWGVFRVAGLLPAGWTGAGRADPGRVADGREAAGEPTADGRVVGGRADSGRRAGRVPAGWLTALPVVACVDGWVAANRTGIALRASSSASRA